MTSPRCRVPGYATLRQMENKNVGLRFDPTRLHTQAHGEGECNLIFGNSGVDYSAELGIHFSPS
jgi:hypothetical protein